MEKIKYLLSSGKNCYSLMHSELGLIEEYSTYLESIAQSPQNTIDSIAQDLKKFLEFIYAFSDVPEFQNVCLNSTALSSLILAFPDYLALGRDATGLAGEIAKITNINTTAYDTNSRILSSVRGFLRESSRVHSNLLALKKEDLIDIDVESSALFKELNTKRKLNQAEQKAILSKSMLAGVISGGSKYIESPLFKPRGKSTATDNYKKAFPFSSVIDICGHANTRRDLCLYALLAGTGIRQSEGLQILLKDIDATKRTIFTIDPERRPAVYARYPLEWRNQLEYKGREIDTTFFIEPFKTIFFDNLPLLIRERRHKKCQHEFLFISMDNAHPSRPHYLSSNKTLNDVFRGAQKRMGMETYHTLHSLRHFYGAWCKNHIKLGENKYGMSISTVQTLMGHASEESTETYAVKNPLILEATINIANVLIEKSQTRLEDIVTEAIDYHLTEAKEKYLGIEAGL